MSLKVDSVRLVQSISDDECSECQSGDLCQDLADIDVAKVISDDSEVEVKNTEGGSVEKTTMQEEDCISVLFKSQINMQRSLSSNQEVLIDVLDRIKIMENSRCQSCRKCREESEDSTSKFSQDLIARLTNSEESHDSVTAENNVSITSEFELIEPSELFKEPLITNIEQSESTEPSVNPEEREGKVTLEEKDSFRDDQTGHIALKEPLDLRELMALEDQQLESGSEGRNTSFCSYRTGDFSPVSEPSLSSSFDPLEWSSLRTNDFFSAESVETVKEMENENEHPEILQLGEDQHIICFGNKHDIEDGSTKSSSTVSSSSTHSIVQSFGEDFQAGIALATKNLVTSLTGKQEKPKATVSEKSNRDFALEFEQLQKEEEERIRNITFETEQRVRRIQEDVNKRLMNIYHRTI